MGAPVDGQEKGYSLSAKRICIIGAGPCGLVSLKTIMGSRGYKDGQWKVVVFEERSDIGGVWNPDDAVSADAMPFTPLYDSMTTNIPHPIMAYTCYPFPPSTSVFPPAATVQSYLQSFARDFDLLPDIRVSTRVVNMTWSDTWSVTLSSGQVEQFDTVIVANGHFRVPRYPTIPGLDLWLASQRATHSMWYRRPQDILAESVLVIGAGPSGTDMAMELGLHSKTVFHSTHSFDSGRVGNVIKCGEIAEFCDDGCVKFMDGSAAQVDRCILATGYQMSWPFLSSSIIGPGKLLNSTYHLSPLARHMFPMNQAFLPTSLVFMGLLLRGTPFSLFEAQALVVIKVLEDPDLLDLTKEQENWEAWRRQLEMRYQADPAKMASEWLRPTEPEAFDYRDSLYHLAGSTMLVEEWEKEMWDRKLELRAKWIDLVSSGKASELVAGISSRQEWVTVLRSLLSRNDSAAIQAI